MDEEKKGKPWEHRDHTPPLIVHGPVPKHIEEALRKALEKYSIKSRK